MAKQQAITQWAAENRELAWQVIRCVVEDDTEALHVLADAIAAFERDAVVHKSEAWPDLLRLHAGRAAWSWYFTRPWWPRQEAVLVSVVYDGVKRERCAREVAADLVQDLVMRRLSDGCVPTRSRSCFSWLRSCAVRLMLDWRRREHGSGETKRYFESFDPVAGEEDDMPEPAWWEDHGSGTDALAELSDRCRKVREAVMSLPTDLRETVKLRYFAGYTYEEIAAVHGITRDGVKKRLCKAHARLRPALTGELE